MTEERGSGDRHDGPPGDPGGPQQEHVERERAAEEDEGRMPHAGRTQGSPPLGPQVMEGEDEIPRQPSPPLDPYTPEPGARPGEARAFRVLPWAWVPVLILVAIILWAALR